jgi:hypothetical protein
MPSCGARFDNILAVNALLFSRQPDASLHESRWLLRASCLIAVAPPAAGAEGDDATVAAGGRETAASLIRRGSPRRG